MGIRERAMMPTGPRAIRGRSRWQSGQSSVEYAIVVFAFLTSIVAMGVVWHAVRDGRLLEVARAASSHSFPSGITIGAMQDIATF